MPRTFPDEFDPTQYTRLGATPLTSPATGQVPLGTASNFLTNRRTGQLMDQGDFNVGGGGFMGGERISNERWQQMLDAVGANPIADQAHIPDNGPPLPLPPGFSPPDPIGDMERWRQSLKDWKDNGMVGPRPMMPGTQGFAPPPPLQSTGSVSTQTDDEPATTYSYGPAANPGDLGYRPPRPGGGQRTGGGGSTAPPQGDPDRLGYQGRGRIPGRFPGGPSPIPKELPRALMLSQFLRGGMRGVNPRANLLLRLLLGRR